MGAIVQIIKASGINLTFLPGLTYLGLSTTSDKLTDLCNKLTVYCLSNEKSAGSSLLNSERFT